MKALRRIHPLALVGWATIAIAIDAHPARAGETPIRSVKVAEGFELPVLVAAPPGDFDRLLVFERCGTIRILKRGSWLQEPYLDITDRVVEPLFDFDERGLLGAAFHPDFEKNRELFLHYTNLDSHSVISRFRVREDLDTVDPESEEIVLVIEHPWPNHNGGSIAFSPKDGYLYIAMGDGGGQPFDPDNKAQDPSTMLGKILRIDVDGGTPYAIPPDNPFVGPGDPLDEIWAIGLRNPWRMSFDRENGDLYIGDVGQFRREEVDYQPATSPGGENYGWRCMEGTQCTGLSGCTCDGPELTEPVYEYVHEVNAAVTGGHVYRGCAIPDLVGTYLFAEMQSSSFGSFRIVDGVATDVRDRSPELSPQVAWVVSLGEDALGELYFVTYLEGALYKIVPDTATSTDCDLVVCAKGNVNFGAGFIDDVLYVNGMTGESKGRVVDVAVDTHFRVAVEAPEALPAGPAPFALYAYVRPPKPSDVTPLPASLQSICMPTPWIGEEAPLPRFVWNNTRYPRLGKADLPSDPAPTLVVDQPAGLPAAFDLWIQGFIADPGSVNGRGSVTNGIHIRIR